VIERIADPVRFASVVAEGRLIGTALGVLVDRALVLECVATRPEARGRGVARAAVGALGAWAARAGAATAALAVLERNAAARRLYERLGLRPLSACAYARPR
jgi:GNAT superfamily N-acetyltransferase